MMSIGPHPYVILKLKANENRKYSDAGN